MKPVGPELIALGGNIRKHRRGLNLSQDELAFRCGLHRTYMSDVERGARNLSFLSLLAIANGLGATISELTAGVRSAADPEPEPARILAGATES